MVNKILYDIFSILVSVYIGYISLRKYYKARVNHENIFYWGLSFLLVMVYSILDIFNILNFNIIRELLFLINFLVLLLQMSGVSLSLYCLNDCDLGRNMTCRFCYKRLIRTGYWVIFVLVLLLLSLGIGYRFIIILSLAICLVVYNMFGLVSKNYIRLAYLFNSFYYFCLLLNISGDIFIFNVFYFLLIIYYVIEILNEDK